MRARYFSRTFSLYSGATVGSDHLLVLREVNPGNPALCLFLSNPANLAAGQTPCGPFNESNVFTTAAGQVINGTRGPLGPNFAVVAYYSNAGARPEAAGIRLTVATSPKLTPH
jgi:hypothetical protein